MIIDETLTDLLADKPYAEIQMDFYAVEEDTKLIIDANNFVIEVNLEDFDFSEPCGDQVYINSAYLVFEEGQQLLFSDDSLFVKDIQKSDVPHRIAEKLSEYYFENIGSWLAEKEQERGDYLYQQMKDRMIEESIND